jgi:lipoyl(octanoyl) transferase
MRQVYFKDFGIIEYKAAWDYQDELMQRNLSIKAKAYSQTGNVVENLADTTDYFLLCAHPAVYTLGKSGSMEHLLVNDQRLKELGVSFYNTNRGGDITFHGPGQIVGYPVLDLEHYGTDLGKYMRNLEEIMIRMLAYYGIEAGRVKGATGVWLDPEVPSRARKICAMGVKCSRWITMHGFALNVNTDLNYFNYIVPCGITDKSVTSMQKELGRAVDINEVSEILKREFENVFGVQLVPLYTEQIVL